jgi:hypothetical protein
MMFDEGMFILIRALWDVSSERSDEDLDRASEAILGVASKMANEIRSQGDL